jgi:hypothetical protein
MPFSCLDRVAVADRHVGRRDAPFVPRPRSGGFRNPRLPSCDRYAVEDGPLRRQAKHVRNVCLICSPARNELSPLQGSLKERDAPVIQGFRPSLWTVAPPGLGFARCLLKILGGGRHSCLPLNRADP